MTSSYHGIRLVLLWDTTKAHCGAHPAGNYRSVLDITHYHNHRCNSFHRQLVAVAKSPYCAASLEGT